VFRELSRTGHNMPAELREQWKTFTDFSAAKFDAQLMALVHLSQFLEDNGIRVMVLKGLGLALLYPEPQYRECSDVDIFCFGEYERVNELLLQHGLISGIEEENDKHCSFCFDGTNIENHRYFSEYVNRANVTMGEKIAALSETDLRTDSRIPGIFFPGPMMGALHLTMHTLSHLAWSGISLRQILDFGLYFNRHRDILDNNAIVALWKEAGIADAALALCALCEDLTGLETGLSGVVGAKHREIAKTILKVTLNPCRSSSEVQNPFIKLVRKYRQFRVRSRMHPTVYGEPFPDSFWKSFSILRKWTS